ncbi:MAG: UDP-N-acetylmuramoyl-L-alanine--D-glutamate ligase [Corynebacterium variabile]|uniref:UDP-N-acetylmuramoyl-L-alanine--D-glutamate ligase n=1 Tax=Corynebacterium variabile TaxID=1727 RepID=UPI002647A1E4|nr:UDP-N-acetylmuramoyl-L-alanine--D-glutamate ligase [Corynebacterium variabile]MDN6536002.1 UDP-N-acetylmuramoyl-L-alanine--D-glutamate ligase [Corynebacterium variabile]
MTITEALSSGRVLVAGAGVAGAGVARMLAPLGCTVTLADDNTDRGRELAAQTGAVAVTVSDAQDALGEVDLLITSPGWRPDSPLLLAAARRGVPVIGDIDAAWLADRAGLFGEPRTWLAVTGTNGKTTTTAMLAAVLGADGRAVTAVGNIGTPPGDALLADPRIDVLAAEVSSFQLHWAPHFAPDAGCVLNLADDHLDWHGSFANYAADKARVLTGTVPVLALDDAAVLDSVRDTGVLTGPHRAVTLGDPADDTTGASVVPGGGGGQIVGHDAVTGPVTTHAPAPGISPAGPAGVADATAAAALARAVDVSPDAVARALAGFTVAAHRGQVVATTDGVDWVDNSKATNPHAAEAALRGLSDVVWVAGGQLKGAAVDGLVAAVAPALKAAVLLGVDRQILADELASTAPDVPVTVVDSTDPEAAMVEVVAAARAAADPGDTVVLAPAAASLDMYPGMSRRGDLFAEYARESTLK